MRVMNIFVMSLISKFARQGPKWDEGVVMIRKMKGEDINV